MIEISKIDDRKKLTKWLDSRPQYDSVEIAARTALRALPPYWEWSLGEGAEQARSSLLLVLRSCLISSICAKVFCPEIVAAAGHAAGGVKSLVSLPPPSVATAPAAAAVAIQAAAVAGRSGSQRNAKVRAAASQSLGAQNLAAIWSAIRQDCTILVEGALPVEFVLWPDANPYAALWTNLRLKTMSAENGQGGDWQFWVDWYEQMLDPINNKPDWELLKKVALIEPEVWDTGPEAVSAAIAKIQRDFAKQGKINDQNASSSEQQKHSSVRSSMEQNRRDIPPTFDAISSLILCEIERLQNKNYTSDLDKEECVRQIGVFLSLFEAIEVLRWNLPETGPIDDAQVETSVSTLQLYYDELKKLPREKIGDVKTGVWDTSVAVAQFGVIGAISSIGIYYGLPQYGAISAAAYLVAPKKAGEILAIAKGVLPTKS